MEKQTSSSIKSFRFLIFCITLSFSIIFLSVLFLSVSGTAAPFPQATNLPFKHNLPLSPPISTLNHSSLQTTSNGFSRKIVKDSVFVTHSNLDTYQRGQRLGDASTPGRVSRKGNGSKVAAAFQVKLGDLFRGDSNSLSENLSSNAPRESPQINSSEVASNSKNSFEAFPQTDDRDSGLMVKQYTTKSSSSSYNSTLGRSSNDVSSLDSVINAPPVGRIDKEKSRGGSCDVTKGKWVFDKSYPLYSNGTCPFIDEGFSCQSNGRLDKDYMKWRWRPNDCDIPRFNASEMLELIRGKRLVFVGDSLNRNQWESMLCMLIGAVKDPKKVYEARGRRITQSRGDYSFKFVDYKCTVEYYVSHFLVLEAKARIGKKRQQILRVDTIDRGSSRWRGADILVFNTAHWWSHHKTKAGINYYQEGNQVYPRLDVSMAFRKAMITLATWIDNNINPRKTQVFFRSYAPAHFSGGQWNSGGHCREASQPSNTASTVSYEKNMVVEDVLMKMTTPVTFLNITEMSNYRIDGHPSIYGRKTRSVEDCSHWCLPGVPDSWNEMLYFHLKAGRRNIRPLWN